MRCVRGEQSNSVQLPTGSKAHIKSTGNSVILGNWTVKNILHVPDFKFNLLSVPKLTKDLSCSVSFFPYFCVLQTLYSGKVIGIGKLSDELYLLKNEINVMAGSASLKDTCLTELWRLRLGNPSNKAMEHIPFLRKHLGTKAHHNCQVCQVAKQSRLAFPDSVTRSSHIFQLIHVDVWIHHKFPTYDRK